MSELTLEDIAIYTVLCGSKDLAQHLEISEEDLKNKLSNFLNQSQPLPFFQKVHRLVLQMSKHLSNEDLENQLQINGKVLGLMSIKHEQVWKKDAYVLEVVQQKRQREGDFDDVQLGFCYKKFKNIPRQGYVSQQSFQTIESQKGESSQEQKLIAPDPSTLGNVPNTILSAPKKQRGKKAKLVVDEEMSYYLKQINDESLKVKDVAERYKVSAACIYQLLKQQGMSAPHKGRGRKKGEIEGATVSQQEMQIQALMQQQQQDAQKINLLEAQQQSQVQQPQVQQQTFIGSQPVMESVMKQNLTGMGGAPSQEGQETEQEQELSDVGQTATV